MEELNEILGMSVYRYNFCICLCVFFIGGLLCVFDICSRLAEECASDPVLKENTFTAPYKHSGAQDSLESLCQCLLRCCDAVWIPTVIVRAENHHTHTYTQMYINHLLILTPCLSFIVVTKHLRK